MHNRLAKLVISVPADALVLISIKPSAGVMRSVAMKNYKHQTTFFSLVGDISLLITRVNYVDGYQIPLSLLNGSPVMRIAHCNWYKGLQSCMDY